MKRLLVLAAALLLAPVQAQAGDLPAVPGADNDKDRAAVIAVTDRFMAAVTTSDTAGFEALFLPSARIYVQRRGPDGTRTFSERPAVPGATGLGSSSLPVREYYWKPTVLVRDGIAVVWTPYALDREGRRSHCGVDVFNLVKVGAEWKIANAMWTIEPDGCPKDRPSG